MAGLSALAVTAIMAPSLDTVPGEPVVVIFSPLADNGVAFRAIANAGASILAIGNVDWIGVSGPLNAVQRQSLREAGAFFFLNGKRAAWLCSTAV
ncbi:hypothetical protein [Palleronia aestuarii]|uniref:hypothetical protein n=1 Tax=Palleronia aestuarii TaxID=568105 RepID=UPI0011B63D9B|nr:hypothetical protein [Palleronia aestuarii]